MNTLLQFNTVHSYASPPVAAWTALSLVICWTSQRAVLHGWFVTATTRSQVRPVA